MPDIQDNLNIAERIMNEKYEMNVVFVDEDGKLVEMQSISFQADGIVEKVANGIAKIRLRNFKVTGEAGFSKIIEEKSGPSITIRVDV